MGRRPFISARTGPEGLLDSIAPPEVPADWTTVSVDGSHIDVDRHLSLRCHLINLGGCAITYGKDLGCELFGEPSPAVGDDDLYLRPSRVPSLSSRGAQRRGGRVPAAAFVALTRLPRSARNDKLCETKYP